MIVGCSARSFPLVLDFSCPGSGDRLAAKILASLSALFLAKNDLTSAIFGELALSGFGFCFSLVIFFTGVSLGGGFRSSFGLYFSGARLVTSSWFVSIFLVGCGGFSCGWVVGCVFLLAMGGGVVLVWLVVGWLIKNFLIGCWFGSRSWFWFFSGAGFLLLFGVWLVLGLAWFLVLVFQLANFVGGLCGCGWVGSGWVGFIVVVVGCWFCSVVCCSCSSGGIVLFFLLNLFSRWVVWVGGGVVVWSGLFWNASKNADKELTELAFLFSPLLAPGWLVWRWVVVSRVTFLSTHS